MLRSADIKLTDDQKEIIKTMRHNGTIFNIFGEIWLKHFEDREEIKESDFYYILNQGLIEQHRHVAGRCTFRLSELGKTIEL